MKENRKSILSQITFSKVTIIITILTILVINNSLKYWGKDKRIIEWDVIIYYAYLPATFIFDDITLNFKNDYEGDKKFTIWAKKTETGNYVLKTTMGPAILYSPFFFVAHVYAKTFGYNTGGYSQPYKIALILSSVFYLLIGLLLVRKILKKFYSETVVGFVLLALALGTNIVWFTTFKASMPHTQSFMLIAIFIFYTIKWHENNKLKYIIIIGLSIGLISLIRPTNILIALFFIFYNYTKFSDTQKQINLFLKNYKQISVIILLAIIIWIPQFLYWKTVTGHYFYYSYGSNERFFFNNPQIINGLFSFRKGLFLYTPVLMFSVLGLPFLFKSRKEVAIPITIFTILNIYIIFSWWAWWYGGSFGQRAFIDSFALAAFPIASTLEYFTNKKKLVSISFLVIFNITILLAMYHTYLFRTGAIHWDGMTKEAYFDSFGRFRPSKKFKTLIKRPDYKAAQEGIEDY